MRQPVGTITTIEALSLRLSGMRGTEEYELQGKGEQTELFHYRMIYRDGEEQREELFRTLCDTVSLLEMLNAVKMGSWNGFDGPHPRNVSDGIMFELKASVNGGTEIHARGSENFPAHFREFTDWLHAAERESLE